MEKLIRSATDEFAERISSATAAYQRSIEEAMRDYGRDLERAATGESLPWWLLPYP